MTVIPSMWYYIFCIICIPPHVHIFFFQSVCQRRTGRAAGHERRCQVRSAVPVFVANPGDLALSLFPPSP